MVCDAHAILIEEFTKQANQTYPHITGINRMAQHTDRVPNTLSGRRTAGT
jgi:hypothetical protein